MKKIYFTVLLCFLTSTLFSQIAIGFETKQEAISKLTLEHHFTKQIQLAPFTNTK